MEFEYELSRESKTHTLTVHFEYTSGVPGCMYQKNGEVGYPEEPSDVEISQVLLHGKNVLEKLTVSEVELISEAAIEHVEENGSDDDDYDDFDDLDGYDYDDR